MTGEIVEQSTPDEARARADRISVAVGATWELIREAYLKRDWAALGYGSWDDYCAGEFGASRLRLPREERQETVASLRESGLSTRAIASATGVAKATVDRDLEAGGPNGPPGSATGDEDDKAVTGTDGKTYKASDDMDPIEKLKTKTSADRLKEFRRLAEEGKSLNEIAKALNTTYAAVHAYANDHNIKIIGGRTNAAKQHRVAEAKKMAAEGYTSRQIAPAIGIGIENFTNFKKRHGVTVPADAAVGRPRRVDHDRVVESTVTGIANECAALDTIGVDLDAVDPDSIDGWVSSLNESIRFLNRFRNQLKEKTQP